MIVTWEWEDGSDAFFHTLKPSLITESRTHLVIEWRRRA